MDNVTLLDRALLIEAYVRPVSKCFGTDDERHRALNRLYDAGLIKVKADRDEIEVTDRGRCLAEALREVPLPMMVWRIPAVSEEVRHD